MSDAKVCESRLERNKEEEECVNISLAVDMMHYATIEVLPHLLLIYDAQA